MLTIPRRGPALARGERALASASRSDRRDAAGFVRASILGIAPFLLRHA